MVAENWPEGPAYGTNLAMKYIDEFVTEKQLYMHHSIS